jgi:hypothetical protein
MTLRPAKWAHVNTLTVVVAMAAKRCSKIVGPNNFPQQGIPRCINALRELNRKINLPTIFKHLFAAKGSFRQQNDQSHPDSGDFMIGDHHFESNFVKGAKFFHR